MFKFHSLLLLAPIALLAPSTQAKPAKESMPKLPALSAAMMPTQILDIATYYLAPAPGEPKIMIHLWSAPRRNLQGAGSFGAPAGTYKGKISVSEVNSFNSLQPSPFTYDIFTSDGKGGWDYINSFVRIDTSAPSKPTIRYLNNVTKRGLIVEMSQFGGQYSRPRTIYVFNDLMPYQPYFTRDISGSSPPSSSGGVHQGFGRDDRGYAQIIKSEDGFDEATNKSFETRTISNWDEDARDWKAGLPIVSERK